MLLKPPLLLEYIPRNIKDEDKEGYFIGLPCPSKETETKLGKEGVERIDTILKAMKRWREILFGENSMESRFDSQVIFRTENADLIYCIDDDPCTFTDKDFYAYPERIESDTNYMIFFASEVKRIIQEKKENSCTIRRLESMQNTANNLEIL